VPRHSHVVSYIACSDATDLSPALGCILRILSRHQSDRTWGGSSYLNRPLFRAMIGDRSARKIVLVLARRGALKCRRAPFNLLGTMTTIYVLQLLGHLF